nr:lethal(2) giant larvae protein homolog 1 [Pelodiscus sinensis]|eukprot:XP_025042165.1 lethal(2) giant larvae protein homolog 1 [Pelodiscus sinensis]
MPMPPCSAAGGPVLRTVEHGFPNQPSSLAYDPKLRIMAVGTKSGAVKVYGAPGVEFTGLHKETAAVTQMHFLPGQGRLLSLLDDNTLHLWEIDQKDGYSHLEETLSFTLPGRAGFDSAKYSPPPASFCMRVWGVRAVLEQDRTWGLLGAECFVCAPGLLTWPCPLRAQLPRACAGLCIIQTSQPPGNVVSTQYAGCLEFQLKLMSADANPQHPFVSNLCRRSEQRVTEGGGVYFLELAGFTLREDQTLYQEEILQSVPDDYRCGKSLGPVESLQEHPQDSSKILIGYSRGLVIVWDQSTRTVSHLFLGNQQLESLGWERSGRTVVSSHSDGGYMVWAIHSSCQKTLQPLMSTIPYGPFPCKAINKVLWRTCESGSHFIIFSGGMPRASYGDRHCVSILQGQTLVTLDFTSRVIDFFTVHNTEPEEEFDNPSALVVLVEEELVVLDLQTPGWPTVPAPYLAPLHSSAITCSYHISNVPLKLWERIISAGEQQSPRHSCVSWPINGGKNLAQEPSQRGLLLTGHEDGTVRFWDASGVSLRPLYKLGTANIFQTDCEHNDSLNQASEEEWPPFRKVGCFDPYSDDPRLGIQKIALCKYTSRMVVAGTAGQVLVMELSDERSDHMISVATVDLLQDREGFTWKGHDRLTPKNGSIAFGPGFQPSVLVQCMPPAAVTAVTLHSEWNLVAFGPSHGFGLFDYYRRNPVLARCTLHPNDSLAMEGPLSRVKSLKKSLRQSFRRIRKSRVSGKKRVGANSPSSKLQEANAQLAEQACPPDVEMAPVQRRIEPRSADDSLSGVVRCLYFADTFLRDGKAWLQLSKGAGPAGALAHLILAVLTQLACVQSPCGTCSQTGSLAPWQGAVWGAGPGRALGSLLSASPQVFMLPKVSAKTKFKLTAHEGCRVRKVALVSFTSLACEDYTENCLACLTNLGDIHIFTVPGLRPQVHYDCIRKEDISGIASCVFTKHGQGFYLISPSEFERFSLSTRNITEPLCSLELGRLRGTTCLSPNFTGTPKLTQANGTHVLQGSEANGSPEPRASLAPGTPEEPQAAFSPTPIDSPSSLESPLDTTGDITVEEVKDFLA